MQEHCTTFLQRNGSSLLSASLKLHAGGFLFLLLPLLQTTDKSRLGCERTHARCMAHVQRLFCELLLIVFLQLAGVVAAASLAGCGA